MNETQVLADWVANSRYEDLPGDVVQQMKLYLLDDLARLPAGDCWWFASAQSSR